MTEKIRKTIYIPAWIAEELDAEGDRYDGPGVVVAASIQAFCNLSEQQKIKAIQDYRNVEVEKAYQTDAADIINAQSAADQAASSARSELKERSKK